MKKERRGRARHEHWPLTRSARSGIGLTARHREILRRLAIVDEGIVEDLAGPGLSHARPGALELKTAALVRVAALAAIGSPTVCL